MNDTLLQFSIRDVVLDLKGLSVTKKRADKLIRLKTINPLTKKLLTMLFDPFHKFNVRKINDSFALCTCSDKDVIMALLNSDRRFLLDNANDMSPEQQYVVKGILGDLQLFKIGITGSSFLTVFPNAFETFGVMLAASHSQDYLESDENKLVKHGIQPKYDGIRGFVIVDHSGDVTCVSRSGKPVNNLDEDMLERLSRCQGSVFDGEAVAKDDEENFDKSSGLAQTKNTDERLILKLFDIIPYDVFMKKPVMRVVRKKNKLVRDHYEVPYIDRHEQLEKTLHKVGLSHLLAPLSILDQNSLAEDAERMYHEFRARKFEGAIVKQLNGFYTFVRNDEWMKMKPLEDEEFEIVGMLNGTGRNKHRLGKLIVRDSATGTETRCGGGLSDKQRDEFWANQEKYIGKFATVKFMEKTKAGKLRHPRFKCIREDI